MKKLIYVCLVLLCVTPGFSQSKKVLFDNTKAETAGNADWVIDDNQLIPSPAQSGITSSTTESYWLGAISAWGVDMVKLGYTVHTLTSSYGITYGNSNNPYALSKNYEVNSISNSKDNEGHATQKNRADEIGFISLNDG